MPEWEGNTLTLRRLHWRHPLCDLRRPFRGIREKEVEECSEGEGEAKLTRITQFTNFYEIYEDAGSGALSACHFGQSAMVLSFVFVFSFSLFLFSSVALENGSSRIHCMSSPAI